MGGQITIWSRLLIKRHFNRRAFLKASLLGAFVLGSSRSGFAQYMTSQKYPSSNLTLYNTHTSEKLTTTYRTPDGDYDAEALKSINWILRCHYTNEVANMDVRVLNFLNMVDNQLGGDNEIHIISGYRSIEYNDLLRRESGRVAKHSLHIEGKAIDIVIPSVNLSTVRKTALALRQGGVGYYPKTGFIHIDCGKLRTW